MSIRRLATLIRYLPSDSATVRALDPSSQWSTTDHLLAAVVDTLRVANWQRAGDRRVSPPTPLQRPGEARPHAIGADTRATVDEMRELQQRWAAGELASPDIDVVEVV
jgi:hypothetical protein